jgi:hypothetical protein
VQLKGRVIEPGHTEYDSARRVFYGGIDRYPAAIVRVADASDVAKVVSLARETGAESAVRGGGHSAAGHGTSDGGIAHGWQLPVARLLFCHLLHVESPAARFRPCHTHALRGVNKVRNSTHRGRRYSRPRMCSPRSSAEPEVPNRSTMSYSLAESLPRRTRWLGSKKGRAS